MYAADDSRQGRGWGCFGLDFHCGGAFLRFVEMEVCSRGSLSGSGRAVAIVASLVQKQGDKSRTDAAGLDKLQQGPVHTARLVRGQVRLWRCSASRVQS